jgi:hypothetical protein
MHYILLLLSYTLGGSHVASDADRRSCPGIVSPTNSEGTNLVCLVPVKAVATAEFNSKPACEQAAKTIAGKAREHYGLVDSVCVPKG